MKPINILFIPSGKRVSLIEAFQTQVLRDYAGRDVRAICANKDYDVPTRFVADKFITVPAWRDSPKRFVEEVKRIIKEEEISIVIPLLDDATHYLLEAGIPVLGSSPSLNDVAYNKIQTHWFLRQHGFYTPPLANKFQGKKLIARPLTGCGAKGQFLIENNRDLMHFHEKRRSEYIINEFISGREFTIDIFKDINQNILAVVPRERVDVRDGEVKTGRVVLDQELINQVTILGEKLDFVGVVCVQAIKSENIYYFIEINDRCGGGLPLSIHAGARFPEWVVDIVNKVPSTSVQDKIKEVKMARADREFFYTDNQKVVCIDYDHTIVTSDQYNEIGDLQPGCRETIQKLRDMGYKIVIYSCRANPLIKNHKKRFKNMLDTLEFHAVPYDEVDLSHKPMADIFIDDKARQFLSWDIIDNEVSCSTTKG